MLMNKSKEKEENLVVRKYQFFLIKIEMFIDINDKELQSKRINKY